MHQLHILNWGLIDYEHALKEQQRLFNEVLEVKRTTPFTNDFLIFCQHTHTFTLGKRGKKGDILIPDQDLKENDISVYHINRGGEVTYHGPGQLVVYPILNLENYFTDVHRFVRFLEEVVMRTLKDFGIISQRINGLTGVWVKDNGKSNKICALGVHLSRWVSMHGIALNINPDLSYFQKIIPCGIQDDQKSVTSMQEELSQDIVMQEVIDRFVLHFKNLFIRKHES